jgi:hypothetical protein
MKKPRFFRLLAVALIGLTMLACTFSLGDWGFLQSGTATPGPGSATSTPFPAAQVTFELTLPAPLAPGQTINIAILDEITGLSLNPALYVLQPRDNLHYTANLPLALGSVVKYRYIRQGGAIAQEDNAYDQPVRYRMHYVTGPDTIQDALVSWNDQPFVGQVGSIAGTVLNSADNLPIPNVLVTAGGVSTLTDSLGQYYLEGLPAGTHKIVAYALDGAYQPFSQGATVAVNAVTLAPLVMRSMPMVQVTFNVSAPGNTVPGAPVRMAGNLIQLGNTFADLDGGLSAVASRMPILAQLSNGHYSIVLRLPAGTDFRYKYTLGDGFWNAEHDSSGAFVVRQLIVPQADTIIQDTVVTWQAGPSSPILFDVTVPTTTPASDTISIQFNPYGWTEPIPMWPLGNNRWVYKLYGPLNMLGTFGYRFCRNDQCGSADDLATAGSGARGRTVSTSVLEENIQDTINGWAWYPETDPATIAAVPVNAHTGFWAGMEFQPTYDPSWQAYVYPAMLNIQSLGSNWVVLAPTWTASRADPLIFAPRPGSDPLWLDTLAAVGQARALNMNAALFAQPRLSTSSIAWWNGAPRTNSWWNDWFEHYRGFALYHADLAAQSGAQALILGGEWTLPAMPNGTLNDGSASGVPADAAQRWRNLLAEVRVRFKGQVLWAVPYAGTLPPAPEFIDAVDAIYLLWSAPLAASAPYSVDDLTIEAGRLMDGDLVPYLANVKKPIIIAVNYPSAEGAATGCVPAGQGGCLDWMGLNRPYDDVSTAGLDLQAQANLYQAMLVAINDRQWIAGFISRGYYPPVALMDKSASVHGKLTADLIWYWFPRLTGAVR